MSERIETKIEDGKIIQTRDGWWDVVTKNNDGEPETTRAYKHEEKVQPAPIGATDLKELLVTEAAPVIIEPIDRRYKPKTKERVTMVGGDAQFPFADDRALEEFLSRAYELQPDEIILVGDMTDLPALSKYPQRKEWVGSTQLGIDQYHAFLKRLRAVCPNARIVVVHGNHEQRFIASLERNMSEIAGIRLAMGERALLSVQNLARYDELEVESIDGYPNGTLWLEDNLKFVHGTNTKKGGFNAGKYLQEESETTIYGHTHRQELAYRTFATRTGSRTIAAASPGALCLTDGSVPGFNFTPNADGEVVKKAEDWQQGDLIIARTGLKHQITPMRYDYE